ncbi:sperm-associated antigen 17-like [Gadus chalcogrammus]|uniref:sperm-associated antigen 17-like n=1 Tax=Gadus chalcogrammus TaxID=1042646 RepID=UPI0024C4C5CD|nr:sperm-associated antigen 17-like [Gadus chalcogrammus]
MPPKRGRSGQTMAAAATNPGWEDGLRTAPFEEGSWRACVSLVVGGAPAEEELMGALQLAVQQPQRRLFTLLSRAAVESTIHDLGNPKAKRPKDLPMFYEVTETAKLLLDADEDVPCELMAFVLKFQMLQVKASDEHRRAGRQSGVELFFVPEGSEDTAQSKAGPASASKRKPPENKAQKGVAPEAPGPEKQTQLKRRGEVVQTVQYIDDEPEDGPQHYILLTGFHQAQLLPALEALGVAVDHVIKVEREHAPEDRDPSGQGGERPGTAQQLEEFWSTLGRVLEGGPVRSKLHDLARLSLTVGDRFNDPGATLALGGYIFEGVACLIYAWLAQQREHQNYLEHLHLTTIPTIIDESVQNSRREDASKVLSRDVDMRYYDNLLEQLPPEAWSVPVILHCMLEQVEMFPPEEGESVAEPELTPAPPGIHRGLARCLLEKFLPLARSQEERRRMLEHLLPEEERRRMLQHLLPEEERRRTLSPGQKHSKAPHGLDPMLVEGSMLQSAPVWRLIGSAAQRGTSRTTAAFKQQLLHYCTSEEASSSTVEHLLHGRLLESMPLAAVDQQGALIRNDPPANGRQPPHGARPEAPCPPATDQTFVTQDPDSPENTSSLLEKLDIFQKGRLRSFSEHRYAEHHDPNIFPQVLQAAMDAALCLDSFQSPLDQTLYVVCHSPRSSQKRCHESWDTVLHTDVAFRKYQEHVANVISDWTRLEGTKREAEQTRNMRLLEPPHDAPPAPEESSPEPSLREDSLKDQPPGGPTAGPPTTGPHDQTAEPPTTGPPTTGAPTAGPPTSGPPTAGPPTAGPPTAGPQDQPPGGPTAEAPAGPHDQPPGPHDQPPGPQDPAAGPQDPARGCPPSPVFRGYRMDGQLVHVSGRLQHLFPSDGGRVTVHRVRFVQGSSLIQVAVKKDGHHFITHRMETESEQTPLEEDLGPPGSDGVEPQGSFSALLDNGVRLSFRYEGKAGKDTTGSPCCPGGLDLPAGPTVSTLDPSPPRCIPPAPASPQLAPSPS